MKKKELEVILSNLKSFENPKVELEQYETPSDLISEIVNELNLMNLIRNKKILEIACGTAKFSIALSFFNPKLIFAFDIDKDAIKIAKENYEKIKNEYENHNISKIFFCIGNMKQIKFKEYFDLSIMNPPFGIQGKIKDLEFLEFAFNYSNFVVSINPNGKNIEFFINFSKKYNFELVKYKKYLFPIKKIFWFHRKKEKKIETLVLFFRKLFS
ncbi:MAG: methyltransferase [Candidatus Aenigmarchaeota archaeon]|nr:methyltransferase [Candidatus Aenigmarchaeota archaeon]